MSHDHQKQLRAEPNEVTNNCELDYVTRDVFATGERGGFVRDCEAVCVKDWWTQIALITKRTSQKPRTRETKPRRPKTKMWCAYQAAATTRRATIEKVRI